jgi:hypothetical protein
MQRVTETLWFVPKFQWLGNSLIHLALGDIVFLQLPGINVVNVNSLHLAHELLSRRANTTGGRRMGYMAGVL